VCLRPSLCIPIAPADFLCQLSCTLVLSMLVLVGSEEMFEAWTELRKRRQKLDMLLLQRV
jgi:hypothetical protein